MKAIAEQERTLCHCKPVHGFLAAIIWVKIIIVRKRVAELAPSFICCRGADFFRQKTSKFGLSVCQNMRVWSG